MSFVSSDVISTLSGWIRPLVGLEPYNKKVVEEKAKDSAKLLAVLEQHLLVHTFLVGERITLADLFTAGLLSFAFQKVSILFSFSSKRKKKVQEHSWFVSSPDSEKSEGQACGRLRITIR